MPHLETRDGTRIHYKDWGSGPPVVLIHGWPLNADMWEYQMPHLAAAGLRCVAYDRRGFGRSDQPWSGYDYDTFADDLADLMGHLDLRDATLVGFSMGGGEVARYMSRHRGERVARAALVAAVTPFLLKTPDNPDGADKSLFDGMVSGLLEDRPHFLAGFGKKFFGAGLLNFSVSDEILDWAQGLALQGSPKATTDCVRAFSETDFRPDMAALAKVPTLVVHGTADQTVPIDISARVVARMVPGARLVEYDGAAHGLFFTERARLTEDLIAFARGKA
jgi:pimeloyl-ACP methyl ester carboxylesterase